MSNATPAAILPPLRRWRNWPLFAILALVVLPGLAAWLLHANGWRPPSLRVHGTLVQPPLALRLPPLRRVSPAATSVPLANLKGKWSLLYLAPAACDAACVASLYGLRMAHIGQGEYSMRVQRLVIASDAPFAAQLAAHDPGLLSLGTSARALAELHRQLEPDAAAKALPAGAIYLLDPDARLVLRYPAGTDARGIRKDLARLLKHSSLG